jgi:predicted DsbA family dithiol-disulfide isomerase
MHLTNVGRWVDIEIYSDVVCPWCYLGKTRLEAALTSFGGEATLRWRAFQLDPNTPSDGRPLIGWLATRFGGEERARQTMAHVTATAEAEGLHLDFDRAIIANTFDAHRLLWFADQPEAVVFGATADTQPELADLLHRAHFTEGLDISLAEELAGLAVRVGLDGDRVRGLLASTEGTADVRAQIAQAHDLGITSVPTFVFAGKYAVTGAQDTTTLRSVLQEVAEREGLSPTVNTFIPSQRAEPATDDDSRVS